MEVMSGLLHEGAHTCKQPLRLLLLFAVSQIAPLFFLVGLSTLEWTALKPD